MVTEKMPYSGPVAKQSSTATIGMNEMYPVRRRKRSKDAVSTSVTARPKNERLPNNGKEEKRWSPECYLGFLLFTICVTMVLSLILYQMLSTPKPKDIITRAKNPTFEAERARVVLMSDNLDCSAFMKRQLLQKVELREVLLAGLQCLFINEPHSVAPDSGISMMIYYAQERESLVNNIELGYRSKDLSKCSTHDVHRDKCHLQSFKEWTTSFVDLSASDFSSKEINSGWLRFGKVRYNKHYLPAFRKLARYEDYGTPEFQSVATTEGYIPFNTGTHTDTRTFLVSRLLANALDGKFYDSVTKKQTKRKKAAELFKDSYTRRFKISSVSSEAKNRILVTKDIARYVVHHFLHCTYEKKWAAPAFRRIRVRSLSQARSAIPHLVFPEGPTHSIFAAFVVKTVYGAFVNAIQNDPSKSKDWRPELHVLYSWTMKAQLLAMHYFVQSREWTGNSEDISMFDRVGLASKYLVKKVPKHIFVPTRKVVDRSASIVIWQKNFTDEIHMLSAALPDLFDSAHLQNKQRSEFSRFEVKTKGKVLRSVPFTSATSVILTEQHEHDKESARPRFVASSSGSIRNIEGVAMALLQAMLYDKSPGDVVSVPSIFLDVSDGKLYCDQTFKLSQENQDLFSKATTDAGLECTDTSPKDFRQNDRIVMFASKKPEFRHYWEAKKGDVDRYIRAAMDHRAPEYNYPVGF